MKHLLFLSIASINAVIFVAPVHGQGRAEEPPQLRWYRGNTHTHTLNSDGNASPDVVVRWYREHGYQFVVITDHEFLTEVAPLNALFGAEGRFLVMSGQEVTQRVADPKHPEGRRQAHLNAINLTRVVMPIGSDEGPAIAHGVTMAETYTRNIAAIRAVGGIAQINHPNWRWSVRPQDLFDVSSPVLMEIWNGIPSINNLGGADENGEAALSAEALWDVLLTRGKTIWGVGSDDSHDYFHLDDPTTERPGQAWIVVRAPKLTPETIADAIKRGQFYASNGITLEEYAADRTSIAITIKRTKGTRDDTRYLTRFIGQGGRVLAEVPGLKPRYSIGGSEGYVRASITDSNGLRAWTQPVFLDARK